jgi:hypothetical protein
MNLLRCSTSSVVIGWPLTNATTCCERAVEGVPQVIAAAIMITAKAFQRVLSGICDITSCFSLGSLRAAPSGP